MFVVGGISTSLIQPHETEWFFEGYGETTVDPLALSYYRHAWAVQDIASYGEASLLSPSAGDERPLPRRAHPDGIVRRGRDRRAGARFVRLASLRGDKVAEHRHEARRELLGARHTPGRGRR